MSFIMKAVFGVYIGSVPYTNINSKRFPCLASLPLAKGFADTACLLCRSQAARLANPAVSARV
jgi:hypothetical protein